MSPKGRHCAFRSFLGTVWARCHRLQQLVDDDMYVWVHKFVHRFVLAQTLLSWCLLVNDDSVAARSRRTYTIQWPSSTVVLVVILAYYMYSPKSTNNFLYKFSEIICENCVLICCYVNGLGISVFFFSFAKITSDVCCVFDCSVVMHCCIFVKTRIKSVSAEIVYCNCFFFTQNMAYAPLVSSSLREKCWKKWTSANWVSSTKKCRIEHNILAENLENTITKNVLFEVSNQ